MTVDFWYPTTDAVIHRKLTLSYFSGSLLNLLAPFPNLLLQQKHERPMGLSRRAGPSHLISLLHSHFTHVLCWAVRRQQGPSSPLPPCFWTDSQRSTFSSLWRIPASAGWVLSPSQHFTPEPLQLSFTVTSCPQTRRLLY